jgi:hypothetical protein
MGTFLEDLLNFTRGVNPEKPLAGYENHPHYGALKNVLDRTTMPSGWFSKAPPDIQLVKQTDPDLRFNSPAQYNPKRNVISIIPPFDSKTIQLLLGHELGHWDAASKEEFPSSPQDDYVNKELLSQLIGDTIVKDQGLPFSKAVESAKSSMTNLKTDPVSALNEITSRYPAAWAETRKGGFWKK